MAASVLMRNGRVRGLSRVAPVTFGRSSSTAAFFPSEPKEPIVKTAIPGPVSREKLEKLSKVFDTQNVNMMADYKKSIGN